MLNRTSGIQGEEGVMLEKSLLELTLLYNPLLGKVKDFLLKAMLLPMLKMVLTQTGKPCMVGPQDYVGVRHESYPKDCGGFRQVFCPTVGHFVRAGNTVRGRVQTPRHDFQEEGVVFDRDGGYITYERQGYLNPNTEVHSGPYPRQVPRCNFQEEGVALDGVGDHITHERQGYLNPTTEAQRRQYPRHNVQDGGMVLGGDCGHIMRGRQGYTTSNIDSHSGPQHPVTFQ